MEPKIKISLLLRKGWIASGDFVVCLVFRDRNHTVCILKIVKFTFFFNDELSFAIKVSFENGK